MAHAYLSFIKRPTKIKVSVQINEVLLYNKKQLNKLEIDKNLKSVKEIDIAVQSKETSSQLSN